MRKVGGTTIVKRDPVFPYKKKVYIFSSKSKKPYTLG